MIVESGKLYRPVKDIYVVDNESLMFIKLFEMKSLLLCLGKKNDEPNYYDFLWNNRIVLIHEGTCANGSLVKVGK
jgi:hypothetical protein